MEKQLLPFVSILVPAYNEAAYLTKTLHALIAQDYPSFEIIVIDNASTDATTASVEAFVKSHPQLQVPIRLLYEPIKGTNHAREAGRRAATGSIIAQVDADCVPGPGWLKKGLRILLRKKNTVAVTGPYDYYDARFWPRYCSLAAQKISYPAVTLFTQALRKSA
ncbi:MAG TPA: glycosyltransferase family A protein, partial [Sediminibacterium sp.]|nr:glycosyltransferase family A protein [Sediminibacterium sp.]